MAARFWVTTGTTGGTGNWSDSQNWSATTGGTAGASVPGSADTAAFDASSGSGTATVDSNVTIQTLTLTGFTGTLAFGTNSISLNSTALIFTGATTCSITGTPVINVTNATATATTVNVNAMTEANSISFNFTGGTYQLTIGNFSAFKNLNFVSSGTTGFGGTLLAHNSADFTIFGNLTLSSNMTHPASTLGYLFAATSGTQIVTSNGKTFDMPMAQTGVGGTTKLADAFAMGATRTFNFVNGNFDGNGQTITGALLLSASGGGVTSFKGLNTARPFTVTSSTTTFTGDNTTGAFGFTTGTLNLGGYILTALSFNSSNGNTRVLNFSTSTINVTNTAGGTLWTTATVTNLTVTGTPIVNISNSGAVATSVIPGALSEANAISFNFINGTYALTFLASANHAAKNVNFSGFGGTWVSRTSASTIYGNLTLSAVAGFSLAGSGGILTFGATSGVQLITSNGKTIDEPLTVNGVGGTVRLADPLTMGATRTLILTNGTLDLNNNVLTTGLFSSSNSNTRTIAFGTGNIVCNAAGGTLWTTATTTGLSVTGTPTVNISNSGAVATSVLSGTLTEAQAISFNFTTGTYALTFLATTDYAAKNVNFTDGLGATGFAGTWAARTLNSTIYGNLTLSSGMTLGTSSGACSFKASSGTQIFTSNTKSLNGCAFTMNSAGTTLQLFDALVATLSTITLVAGTFDANSQSISCNTVTSTGTVAVKNYSSTGNSTFYLTSGTLTQGAANTFFSFQYTAGTLNLNGFNLTCAGNMFSNNSNTRQINFGSSKIIVTGSGTNAFNFSTTTGLSTTGDALVEINNNTASSATVSCGTLPEAQSMSFNFVSGTYALTFLANLGDVAKNVNFSGFGGTWVGRTNANTIYGNLTLSAVAGFSFGASAGAIVFGATSGTQIVTTNAKTIELPLTVNGAGGTVQLADALLMGTTRAFTHTNGTLDLNGKTLTVGSSYTTAAGTKVLTFNGGTLICPAATTTAFNNAVPAGFSTVAGTGTGKISMTAATAKTFVGGGSTYNCTLSQDGSGTLTISGSNTFTTIANGAGIYPTTMTFTAGTTTTISNWDINGGIAQTVTINSTAASNYTFSKSSGIVFARYITISRSTATGGATWYASIESVDGGNNSGWIFGLAKFWVGGSNTWSNAASWATTSGGAGGAGINYADFAHLDLASGSITSTIDGNFTIQGMNISNFTGTLAFGTNSITLVNSVVPAGQITFLASSSYSVSGTPVVNVTNPTNIASTVTPSNPSEANTISFNFTGGTYALTFPTGSRVRSLNFTGFSGSIVGGSNTLSVYGNLTLSATATLAASTNTLSFPSTSATTRIITTNGVTIDRPLSFNGSGGSWRLADALTMASSRQLSHSNGTLDLNGKVLIVGTSYTTASGTKNLTFNGGELRCPAATTTAFNNAQPTNFTTTAGTGTGYIRMTGATAKTFVGGGSTYNCTLSNDTSGALTISGNNTFTTIANGTQPTTFTFTAGTTQTITNWGISGTAGNLVAINSSAAGTPASLSKASGTVSADYLSIQDSAAAGGASWYAGANSTNVSGNSGWIFSAPPVVTAGGNFFFMF